MLNGTFRDHVGGEQALRDFYDMSGAIVFLTGYMANLGMISTLAGKGEYVILDADSHASIYDGCKQGVAEIVRFRHNDVADLDKRLGRLPADAGKLVVLEGVYSMLGDIAPLREMVAVAKKHGCMVLVDEAHSMGFFGPNGRGVYEDQGLEGERSEEHTSELQSLMRISYAVFCLKKKNNKKTPLTNCTDYNTL